MTRTIILATLFALTIAAPAGANDDDRLATASDGTVVQAEYIAFYERHKNDPRIHVIEDDLSVVLMQCTSTHCLMIDSTYEPTLLRRR